MNDQQASVAIEALLELALAVRDEGPTAVHNAAQRVLDATGGDPLAAVGVAAALIRVDLPLDLWWTRGLAGVGVSAAVRLEPCGTHAAFNRHKSAGQKPCELCTDGEQEYQHNRRLSTLSTNTTDCSNRAMSVPA